MDGPGEKKKEGNHFSRSSVHPSSFTTFPRCIYLCIMSTRALLFLLKKKGRENCTSRPPVVQLVILKSSDVGT